MTLQALVIDNGIGSERAYPDQENVRFDCVATGPRFAPDLSRYDLLVVPNGADHIAMFQIRDQVRAMLNAGKSVLCCCGWFTDWVPGNRWIHDNSHPTKEVRHFPGHDPHGLLEGFDLAALDHNPHGISGWWACGYIQPSRKEAVLVKDTWDRAVVVADEISTNGFLFLTASGPVGNYSRRPDSPLAILYQNVIRHVERRASASSRGDNHVR